MIVNTNSIQTPTNLFVIRVLWKDPCRGL